MVSASVMQARPAKAKQYGIRVLNRALDGVTGTTAVHICFGYAAKRTLINVLKDNRVAVIATENGTQPLTYQMRVGDSAPLYTFSAGKVALSFYSEAELKYYFAHVKPRTAH
jgi:hypothetical protein